MSNSISGREFIAGFKKSTVWGTAVALGADDGMLLTALAVKPTRTMELDDSAGQQWITDADPGPETVSGTLEGYLRYRGLDVYLAALMGTGGAPAQLDTTTAYSNSLLMQSSIQGIFGTFAAKMLANKVWENPSLKVHGMKISGEANKPCTFALDVTAHSLNRASAVNTVAVLDAVVAKKGLRCLMNNGFKLWIGDADGAALSAVNALDCASFELNVSRPMAVEQVAGSGNTGVAEPDDDGFPTIELTVKMPRYSSENDAFFDAWVNSTAKKVALGFTGPEIEGGHDYSLLFEFPNMRVDNPEAAMSGAGKIPFSMKLTGIGCETAPNGMDFTAPMRITTVNTRDTAAI